jgi:hypothetical protein
MMLPPLLPPLQLLLLLCKHTGNAHLFLAEKSHQFSRRDVSISHSLCKKTVSYHHLLTFHNPSGMTLSLQELFRMSSDTAARVKNHVVHGTSASDALLDDLARVQRMCLDAMHARLLQKASNLDLASVFVLRLPSPSFVCDFSDIDDCMRYVVKCCESCRTAEQMRQLVPILRCFQSNEPRNSVLLPLFIKMGGLSAVLEWAKRMATQLKMYPDSQSMVVLTGILHIISKFNVLPHQTVPSGACNLLLDVMAQRLPQISACVGAVLRCWMKCAERHASSSTRDSTSVSLKPNLASPSARSASLPRGTVTGSCISVGNSEVPCLARSADSCIIHSHKLLAELYDDDSKVENVVHQSKRPCKFLPPPTSSKKTLASTACGNSSNPSPYSPDPTLSSIRQDYPAQRPPGGRTTSSDLNRQSPGSCQSSTCFSAHQYHNPDPAAFDGSDAVHALDALASILRNDASSMLNRSRHSQDLIPTQSFSQYNAATAVDHSFSELFAPPTIQDDDFFYGDEQFFADDGSMTSDAINSAFIAALQEFGQRDELRGLQSLCARFCR